MRRVLVGAAAAVLVLSGGAASASEHPAPDEDDGWAPVPEEYYAGVEVEVEACGSVVTISNGDVREVEQRSEVLDDGTVFTEYRGAQTVDLTRASDGASIDELDISGPSWNLVSADGTQVLVELDGPSMIWALNDVERAAADEEGLPYLMYFEEGTVLFRLMVDPATGETTAVDPLRRQADIIDVCGLFGEPGEG